MSLDSREIQRAIEEALEEQNRRFSGLDEIPAVHEPGIRFGGRGSLLRVNSFDAYVGLGFWGPWVAIWSQVGVIGPDRDRSRYTIDVSYRSVSGGRSSFDVEIKGGDEFVRSVANGSGSERVTISGNVATTVSIRFRSHSFGQDIRVKVIG